MNTKTTLQIIAIVAALGVAITSVATANNIAYAKITAEDTSCTNGGGNQPGVNSHHAKAQD